MSNRRRQYSVMFAIALSAGLMLAGCTSGQPEPNGQARNADGRVERGKYLVTVGGCNDCHTPLKMGPKGPEPDMDRMLSGHPETFPIEQLPVSGGQQWMMTAAATGTAFAGPWGVSFTANLTPDTNTGLGIWTEEMFINTIRTGKHWGVSRDILPPMPWFNYREMNDDDLKAVFAYLRSIKPITNHVPTPLPPAAAQQASNHAADPQSGGNQ
jgi:mono/diheme cytochrome c family protein